MRYKIIDPLVEAYIKEMAQAEEALREVRGTDQEPTKKAELLAVIRKLNRVLPNDLQTEL